MRKDNRWHLKGTGNLLDSLLIEWKYFNIIDKDIQGFFSYFEANPKNILNFERTSVNARVFYKGKNYGEINLLKHSNKKFSDKTAKAFFNKRDRIEVINKDKYQIFGENKQLKWDLVFRRLAKPVQKKYFLEKKQYIVWRAEMPIAKVNGAIELKKENKRIKVDSFGYSDGNWGRWIFPSHMWFWMNYSKSFSNKKDLFFVASELYNDDKRNIIIKTGNKKIEFDNFDIEKVIRKKKKIDIPIKTRIYAKKGNCRLEVETEEINSDLIFIKTPLFFPNFYLVNQIAKINGYLKLNNKLTKIDGKVMLEYTTK
ncbi:hypothetical protein KY342_07000 [Candidatus Woesearchaeota archaeon]|nr:hypothetical protein [Candidatus Woesearchaeota archaeon]